MILKTLILCEDMLPVVMCISISPSLRPVPWIGYWCPDLFSFFFFVRNTPFHNVLQKALDRLVFSNLSLGLCVVIAIWSHWHEHRYFPFSTSDDLLVCLAPSSLPFSCSSGSSALALVRNYTLSLPVLTAVCTGDD